MLLVGGCERVQLDFDYFGNTMVKLFSCSRITFPLLNVIRKMPELTTVLGKLCPTLDNIRMCVCMEYAYLWLYNYFSSG